MTIIYDRDYGADADGNRGISVIDDWYIDESDYDYIREYIFNNSDVLDGKEYNDMISMYFDEVEDYAELEISEYLSEYEFNKLTEEIED